MHVDGREIADRADRDHRLRAVKADFVERGAQRMQPAGAGGADHHSRALHLQRFRHATGLHGVERMEGIERLDEVGLGRKRGDVVEVITMLKIVARDDRAGAGAVDIGCKQPGIGPGVDRERHRQPRRPRCFRGQFSGPRDRLGRRRGCKAVQLGLDVVIGKIAADPAVDAQARKPLPARDRGLSGKQRSQMRLQRITKRRVDGHSGDGDALRSRIHAAAIR